MADSAKQQTARLADLGLSDDDALVSLMDASLDCIKIVESDGTLSFMNSNGMCAMDIDAFSRVDGARWSDLWPADAQPLIEDAVDRALRGEAVRLEAFCPTALGHPRWWDVTVSPIEQGGKVTRLLSISRDISDRVLREQRADDRERQAVAALRAKSMLADPGARYLAKVGPEADLEEASTLPSAEALRQHGLDTLHVLDTDPDPRLDRITELAARALGMPTALVSLVDRDRQWFLSRTGMELCETPRSQSFCSIAIQTPDHPFVVEDARINSLTRHNPLVTAEGGIRAYLGIPLVLSSGEAIGSLCVLGPEPRTFSETDKSTLRALADGVVAIIEQKAADARAARMEILASELKHRMGNTYAQVSSLVGLLAPSSKTKDNLALALRENINALARTQARIAHGGWSGIDLCGLTEEVFGEAADRIRCNIDPNFDITPNAAFLLTLALQELATNSRKHGALRDPDKTVSVAIRTTEERLVLDWREGTAPDAGSDTATPTSGFGQKLLSRIVPLGLGGTASLRHGPRGAHYRLDAPRNRIELPG